MEILTELVSPAAILLRQPAENRRQLLEQLAQTAHDVYGVDAAAVLDSAWQREMLGTTAVGEGVAVPHARVLGLEAPKGVIALLETPLDFAAPDGRPCDLIVFLISPEGAGADHLKALARISRAFRQSALRDLLRDAKDALAAHAILTGIEAMQAA